MWGLGSIRAVVCANDVASANRPPLVQAVQLLNGDLSFYGPCDVEFIIRSRDAARRDRWTWAGICVDDFLGRDGLLFQHDADDAENDLPAADRESASD